MAWKSKQINQGSSAAPQSGVSLVSELATPSSTLRGSIVVLTGSDNTPDGVYTCIKLADGTYAWTQLS